MDTFTRKTGASQSVIVGVVMTPHKLAQAGHEDIAWYYGSAGPIEKFGLRQDYQLPDSDPPSESEV